MPGGALGSILDRDPEIAQLVADLVGELEVLGGPQIPADLKQQVDEGGGSERALRRGGRFETEPENSGELAERGAGRSEHSGVAALALAVRLARQVEQRGE